MKKILFASLMAVIFAITGCDSKNDDIIQGDLSNTTWERKEKLVGNNSYEDIFSHIEFQSQTFSFNHSVRKKYSDGSYSDKNFAISGNYYYEAPRVILRYKDEDDRVWEIEFIVFKNYISNDDYGSLNKI